LTNYGGVSISHFGIVGIDFARFLNRVYVYKVTIPALDMSAVRFSPKHIYSLYVFLEIVFFHVGIKDGSEIVTSAAGTISVFKK